MAESAGATFRELQALLRQAVEAMGESRTALVAGCSVSAVQAWLRRSALVIPSRAVQRAMPRLRMWESWVPGYEAARRELERMQAEPHTVQALLGELRTSLAEVVQWYSLTEIANGCEISKTQLETLRAGYVPERHVRALITAVAHLRFWRLWPASVAQESLDGSPEELGAVEGPLLPVAVSHQ